MKIYKRLAAVLVATVIGSTVNIPQLNIHTPLVGTLKAEENLTVYYDEARTAYATVSYDANTGMPTYDFTHTNGLIDWSQIPTSGLFPLKEIWKKPTEAEFTARVRAVEGEAFKILYYDPDQYKSVADFLQKNDTSSSFALIIKNGSTDLLDFNRYDSGCGDLKNVKYAYIPETVMSVKSSKFFNGLSNLKEVILSSKTTVYPNVDSVTQGGSFTFGLSPFNETSSLEQMVIPPTVTQFSKYINNCGLSYWVDTDQSKSVAAAYNCNNLKYKPEIKTLLVGENTKVPECYLYRTRGINSVILPEGITEIGYGAFYKSGITEIEIPASCIKIDKMAFANTTDLEGVIYQGNQNIELGSYAFANSAVRQMNLPEGLTKISEGALQDCTNLQRIVIPDSCTSIEANALKGCNGITEIVIKSNTINIDPSAIPANSGCTIYAPESVKTQLGTSGCEVKSLSEYMGQDSVAPTVSASVAYNDQYSKGIITAKGSDNLSTTSELKYSIDAVNYQSSNSFTVTRNGNYTVYCKDANDNVGETTVLVDGIIDETKPEITAVDVQLSADELSAKLVVHATDNQTEVSNLKYSLDGVSFQESNLFNVTKNKIYTVYCQDEAGNIGEKQVEVTNIKDIVKPIISSAKVNYAENQLAAEIEVTASDNQTDEEKLKYSIDGINYTSGNTLNVTKNGNYTIYCKDEAGLVSEPYEVVVNKIVDNESPVIDESQLQVKYPEDHSYSYAEIIVLATDDKTDVSQLKYSYDGENYQSSNRLKVYENGTYYVRCKDSGGNVSEACRVVVDKINRKLGIVLKADSGFVTEYRKGETSFKAGGTLVVTTDNEVKEVPITAAMISGPTGSDARTTLSTAGIKALTITYEGQTITQDISVKELTSIALKEGSGIRKNYNLNDTLDRTGTLLLNYSDGSQSITEEVPLAAATLSSVDFSTTGSKTVTVSYTDRGDTKTTTYDIAVGDPIKPVISNVAKAHDTDTNKVTLTATASDNHTATGNLKYALNGGAYQTSNIFEIHSNGNYYITCKDEAGNISEAYWVSVIEISDDPVISQVKVTYNTPDYSCATLTVTAKDNDTPVNDLRYSKDGVSYQASNEIKVYENGTYYIKCKDKDGNVSGDYVVTVDKIGKKLGMVVKADSGFVTDYRKGETSFKTGGTLVITTDDEVKEVPITADMISAPAGSDAITTLSTAGTKTLTITYNTQTITQDISVKELTDIAIKEGSGVKKNYNLNDVLDQTGILVLTYSDGSKDVTEEVPLSAAIFSSVDFSTTGSKTVTVSYTASGNTKTTTYSIMVGDAVKPIISAVSKTHDASNNKVTLKVTASDDYTANANLRYAMNGGGYQTSNEFVVSSNGNYYITCQDEVGNISEAYWVSVIEISDDPVISQVKVTYNTPDYSCATLTVTAKDNDTAVNDLRYSKDGVSYQASNEIKVYENGTYYIKCKDKDGNVSGDYVVTVDKIGQKLGMVLKADGGFVTDYRKGETSFRAGGTLVVTTDSKVEEVPITADMISAPADSDAMTTLSTAGTKTLTIKYAGKTITQDISVKELTRIALKEGSGVKKNYNLGDPLDQTGTLLLTYSDGENEKIEELPLSAATFSSVDFSTTGSKTVTVSYTDTGNTETATYNITVGDAVKPIISDVNKAHDASSNKVTLKVTASDDYTANANLRYALNGGAYQNSNEFVISSNGNYYITCQDEAGNISEAYGVSVIEISDDPVISQVEVTYNTLDYSYATLTITAKDNDTALNDLRYSKDGVNYQVSNEIKVYENGTYYIKCRDKDGNVSGDYIVRIDKIGRECGIAVKADSGFITDYRKGKASFEAGGTLVVTTDEEVKEVPITAHMISGPAGSNAAATFSTAGTKTLTITYDSQTVTQDISVKELTGIAIKEDSGVKKNYNLNDTLDQTGTLLLTYSDGEHEKVEEVPLSAATFSSVDFSTTGSKNVTVSYTDTGNTETATYNITVGDVVKPIISDVNKTPDTNSNKVTLQVTASDNYTANANLRYALNGGAYQTSNTFEVVSNGNYSITCQDEAGNISEAYSVTVTEIADDPVISKVVVDYNKVDYSYAILKVTAEDNDTSINDLRYSKDGVNYQVSNEIKVYENGTYYIKCKDKDGNVSGDYVVTVDKIGRQCGMVLKPDSGFVTEYRKGDTEFKVGGTVIVTTEDEVKEVQITTAMISGSAGSNAVSTLSTAGIKTLTITYDSETLTQDISVKELTRIALKEGSGVKKNYNLDSTLDQTGTLVLTYSDGSQSVTKEVPLSAATLSSVDFSTIGSRMVTVTYTDGVDTKTTTYEITVGDYAKPTISGVDKAYDASANKVTLTVTASDNHTATDHLQYALNGGIYQSSNIFEVPSNGSFFITCQDEAGNVSEAYGVTITEIADDPVISNVDVSYNTPDYSYAIIKITAMDNDTALNELQFSKDGINYQMGNEIRVTENGTYHIKCKDKDGNSSEDHIVVVDKIGRQCGTVVKAGSGFVTEYRKGDTSFSDGGILVITTDDEIKEVPITAGMISDSAANDASTILGTAGKKIVTITDNGHTATQEISVKELTGIAIKEGSGFKTAYTAGEELSRTGKLVLVYSDGSTSQQEELDLSSGEISISGFNSKVIGTQTLTVSYKGLSIPVNITIMGISYIGFDTNHPVKTTYVKGEDFKPQGKILVFYTNGTQELIDVTADMKGNFDTSEVGNEKEASIVYKGISAKYKITVVEPVVEVIDGLQIDVVEERQPQAARSKIAIKVTDRDGIFSYILLPDGNHQAAKELEYFVYGGGNYEFKVYTKGGTVIPKSITIEDFDTTSPEITFNYTEGDLSQVKVKVSDQEFDRLVMPDGTIYTSTSAGSTSEGTEQTFDATTLNGTFTAYDKSGNKTEKAFNVTPIVVGNGLARTYLAASGMPESWTNENAEITISSINNEEAVQLNMPCDSSEQGAVEAAAVNLEPLVTEIKTLTTTSSTLKAELIEEAEKPVEEQEGTEEQENTEGQPQAEEVVVLDEKNYLTSPKRYWDSKTITLMENMPLEYSIVTSSGAVSQTLYITKIDKELPILSLSTQIKGNETEVNYTAADGLSGIKSIYLPNGEMISIDHEEESMVEGHFTISSEGKYKIVAKDYAGNSIEKYFDIAPISELPTPEVPAPEVSIPGGDNNNDHQQGDQSNGSNDSSSSDDKSSNTVEKNNTATNKKENLNDSLKERIEQALKNHSIPSIEIGSKETLKIEREQLEKLVDAKQPLQIRADQMMITLTPEMIADNVLKSSEEILEISVADVEKDLVNTIKETVKNTLNVETVQGMELYKAIDLRTNQQIMLFEEPMKLQIELKNAGIKESSKLTLVRYEKQENGALKIVKLGGTYDPNTKILEVSVDKPGIYGVAQTSDLMQINLDVSKNEIEVNDTIVQNDVMPIISNGRVMVPLRFVAENLNCEVKWNSITREVSIFTGDKTLKMKLGEEIEGYGVAPMLEHDRVFVPIRYVSEALGANVLWVPSRKLANIVK